ncbi:MAG: hypothetical protein PVI59_01465 [Anaerolineae bacterium]|jgi:hypothetical protein
MKRHLLAIGSILVILTGGALALRPASAEPAVITPLPPVSDPDGRAGACYSYLPDATRPYLPLALDTGARWDRFDFNWAVLEPDGDDQWSSGALDGYDTLVDDLDAAGVNMVGILLWTPDWASTGGWRTAEVPSFDQRPAGWYAPTGASRPGPLAVSAASTPPNGLDLDWDDPGNTWGDFVYDIVSRYGDRVRHWEMWNEAEWDFFWSGTDADYARLLEVGYRATKAACPDCTVLFAGLHFWDDQGFYERVLDIINNDPDAASNNYYFDVMSVHLYASSAHPYDIVNHIRSRMTSYVSDHPIWLTETGVAIWDDASIYSNPTKYDWSATQAEAGAYVVQSYANAIAAGVERYFHFRVNDDWCDKNGDGDCNDAGDGGMSELFGMARDDQSLRPSYVAYQVANTYFISPTFTTRVARDGVARVTLWGTPHGKVSAVWNTTPDPLSYDYSAAMPTATRVSRLGVTETITAASGVYTFSLPAATASLTSDPSYYYIGGDPVIVIESEAHNVPPTSTIHALPTTTFTSPFTVTWEGEDNQAGVWLYDIQVRDEAVGTWEYWQHSTQDTSGAFSGEHGHTYCFRSRATDRLGFREAWPEAATTCTTLDLDRELYLDLQSVFGDEDGDDEQDAGEDTLMGGLGFRLVDTVGADVVTPTVGASWAVTVSLIQGDYTLIITPEDWWSPAAAWMPRWLPISVEGGVGTQIVTLPAVGLLPHRSDVLLPLVSRGP